MRVEWLLLILPFQIEQLGGANVLAGEAATCCGDRRNATPRGLHLSQTKPEKVLAAIAGFASEMRGFDPSALQERFETRGHVQYVAS